METFFHGRTLAVRDQESTGFAGYTYQFVSGKPHVADAGLIQFWAGGISFHEVSHFVPEKAMYEEGFI